MALITTQLGIVNTNQPIATGGSAQAATDARDAALALLQPANGQVQFFFCSATDEIYQTAELVRVRCQPRRDSGAAGGNAELAGASTTVNVTAIGRSVAGHDHVVKTECWGGGSSMC